MCRTQWRPEPESEFENEPESEPESEPDSEQDSAIDEVNHILYNAAESGDERLVRQMLNQGADGYNEAMVASAYNGHIEIVRLLLAQAASTGYLKHNYLPRKPFTLSSMTSTSQMKTTSMHKKFGKHLIARL